MEDFLKELGFTNLTGLLWKHNHFGIMQFDENESKESIVNKIYDRGYKQCQSDIRESLGITKF